MINLRTVLLRQLKQDNSDASGATKARRPELEQALLRVVIAFIVMVYLFWYTLRDLPVTTTEARFSQSLSPFSSLASRFGCAC